MYAGNLFSSDCWYIFALLIILFSQFLAIGIPVGAMVIVGAFTVVIILWIFNQSQVQIGPALVS